MSPDGFAKPPPEEKLLKLIRGKDPRSPAAGSAPVPLVAGPATAAIASGAHGWLDAAHWPKIAVWFLGGLVVLEALGFVVQALSPLPVMQVPSTTVPQTVDRGHTALPPQEMPSLAESASRPLFASSGASGSETPHLSGSPSGSARLLAARLTLKGIMAGNPAQAILEDSQTNKTYFATVGQAVVDGAVLEQVLENRVILNLDGEKIELSL